MSASQTLFSYEMDWKEEQTFFMISDYASMLGVILLSTYYRIDEDEDEMDLSFKCEHGHIFTQTWDEFQNWKGCIECQNKEMPMNELQKKKYKEVLYHAASKNITLISKYYVDAKTKLEFKCSKNHRFITSVCVMKDKRGYGCPECGLTSKHPAVLNFYKFLIEKGATRRFEDKYIDANTPVSIICDNMHNLDYKPIHVYSKSWCIECCTRGAGKAKKYFIDELEKQGCMIDPLIDPLNDYINAHLKIYILCSNNHKFLMSPMSCKGFVERKTLFCTICSEKSPSIIKQKFFQLVKEIGGTVIGIYINKIGRAHV